MAFPLLYVVLSLSLGIFSASFLQLPVSFWLALMGFCLIGSWGLVAKRKNPVHTFWGILLSCFFLGGGLLTLAHGRYQTNALTQLKTEDYLDFQGTLYKSPVHGYDRNFLYLRVEKTFLYGRTEKMQGYLRISFAPSANNQKTRHLMVGDQVRISARISDKSGSANFQEDQKNFGLKAEKIHSLAFTKSPQLIETLAVGSRFAPGRIVAQLRRSLQKRIEAHFWSSDANRITVRGAILEALLLGQRGRLAPDIHRNLQASGLYHLLAISGAHVAIICFFLFQFFKILRVPKRISYLLLVVFLGFYAMLVEGRPSVIRATLMTGMYLLGKYFWKDINLLNTLSLSALVLLVMNPFNLFTLGFQLSFTATLAIILFFPHVIRHLPQFPLRLNELFAVTLTAQAGVLPIVAAGFNRITLSAFLLNFAALPLLFFIMAAGFLFLPLSFVCAPLAELWSQGLGFGVDLLLVVARLSTGPLAFLSYRIPTPHAWTSLGYFLSGLLLLLPSRHRWQRSITMGSFLVFLGILLSYPFSPSSGYLRVTFLDVGQGDSILIEFPGREKMLVDGGGSNYGTFDVGEHIVSPFLWRKGIKRIDFLVSTHPHPDHLRGLQAVLRNFRVGEFWEAFSYPENPVYRETVQFLPPELTIRKLYRGDVFTRGTVRIEVVHPQRSRSFTSGDSNDLSLVLRIRDHKTAFLLTGDIEIPAENDISDAGCSVEAHVLKAPHHGSRSSSSWKFLQAVSPHILVISVGKNNRYNFPDPLVLQRYAQIGARVYRTDRDGAIEITSRPQGCFVRTARK